MRASSGPGSFRVLAATCLVSLVPTACSPGGDGPTDPTPTPSQTVAEYISGLPTWRSVNPLEAEGETKGSATQSVVAVTDYIDPSTGNPGPVNLVCTEQAVSLKDNTTDIVILNPSAGLIWPGAFIQGKSRAGSSAELLPLVIAPEDRTPITLFLEGITTSGTTSVTVNSPSASAVNGARSQLVLPASTDSVGDPTKIVSSVLEYYSDAQFAAEVQFSGKYLNWSSRGGASYRRSQTENSVIVYFAEQMYTLAVDQPPSPTAWFGPGFTREELDAKIAAGQIGPDNLPVYVASVTYGRIMMATFTAKTDLRSLKTALQVRYKGLVTSASGSLTTEQSKMIGQTEKYFNFWGGSSTGAQDAIQNGNWEAYFDTGAQLSQAVPISFTLRTLNNELASVTDATQYTLRDCQKSTSEFVFLPSEPLTLSLPTTSRVTRTGDFNGDGLIDLLWDHDPGNGGAHRIAVAYGKVRSETGAGGFDVVSLPTGSSPIGLGAIQEPHVGDLDGDGTDDVLWWEPNYQPNRANLGLFQYVLGGPTGLSQKGEFEWLIVADSLNVTYGPAVNYKAVLGNFQGSTLDGLEIAMSTAGLTDWNRVYRFDFGGLGQPFITVLSDQNAATRDHGQFWTQAKLFYALDYVGDTFDDLMFAVPNGDYLHTEFTSNTGVYRAGDQDMDGPVDWHNANEQANFHIVPIGNREGYGWLNPGVAQPTIKVAQWGPSGAVAPVRRNFGNGSFKPGARNTTAVGDLDGTGEADYVVNALNSADGNLLRFGYNFDPTNGTFESTYDVVHPTFDTEWGNAKLYVGDIDGDAYDDLIWVVPAGSNVKVYVALWTGPRS